jgi:catechol 2,3-dioxygenase-like lactoylglutathione lyase family enzyme
MKTLLPLLLVFTAILAHSADRPKITGIDHVVFYTTSPVTNKDLYMDVLGLASLEPLLEPRLIQQFAIGKQWVGYITAPDPNSSDRLDHLAFVTENCSALRAYLAAKGVKVPGKIISSGYAPFRSFSINDPEGHSIEFIEHTKLPKNAAVVHIGPSFGPELHPIASHIIHVGFVVHDRAAEDHFYKDILGFHLYWYGGMQDDRTDWVSMQVPDGTDWVEYMLNIKPNADLRATGVMNHISLGVKDMKQAEAKVDAAMAQTPPGSKPRMDEHPKIGRGGKWQFNIYDPDQTRIELMEFTPAQKPCCSEYQGPHPSE